MKKVLLTSAITMMCLLCSFGFTLAYAGKAQASGYTWKVYLDNKKMTGEVMYAYVWDAGNNDAVILGNWPGTPMTTQDNVKWECSFTTETDLVKPMIVFNNGVDQQTIDLELVNGKTYLLEEIEVDGIYYAIKSEAAKTVVVTYRGNYIGQYRDTYKGKVVIPSTITYKNDVYTVEEIGRNAFYDCVDLTSITIPATVKLIDLNAFAFNNKLDEIIMEPTTPPTVYYSSFYDTDMSVPVYVPVGCVDVYKNEPFWMLFTTIVEKGTKVYRWKAALHNTKFSGTDMYVYMWDEGDGNKELLGSWPGTLMNRKGNDVYEYAFNTTYELITPMIIFNNGNGEQTADLDYTNGMVFENFVTVDIDNISYDIVSRGLGLGSYPQLRVTAPSGNVKYEGDVVIPNLVSYQDTYYTVISIDDFAFRGCDKLTSITIPSSLTTLGNGVFVGCTSLSKVVWNAGNATTYTEEKDGILYMYPPFAQCPVTEFEFGELVYTIPKSLCSNLVSLTRVVLPESLYVIDHSAFSYCTALEEINFPANLNVIADYAFAGCSSLNNVVLSDNINSLGNAAFWQCGSITSINIPASLTAISNYAFSETGLQSVVIPNHVTQLGESAFWGCSALEQITIGTGVTRIGNYTFSRCTALKSVEIPNSVLSLGDEAFWGCTALQSAVIGNGVKSIGNYSFSRCESLSSVYLGENIETLADEVFWSCSSLASITLPAKLQSIGNWCFENCTSLLDVYTQAQVPPTISQSTFTDAVTSVATLHTPNGYSDVYAKTLYWKDFSSIVGDVSGVGSAVNDNWDIRVTNGTLAITGVADNAVVNIYTMGGALLHNTTAGNVANVALTHGAYLVQVGGTTRKVVL